MPAAGARARGRILEAISSKPGIHVRELERVVGISGSGISHHLHALEKHGQVVGISDGHYRRYFQAHLVLPQAARQLNDLDRRLLGECRRPASLAIVLNLAVDGPMSHSRIQEALGRSKGTVTYHLNRLVESAVLTRREASTDDLYELVEPIRVVALLTTFSSSFVDHVDGFARLWLNLREPPPSTSDTQ